MSIDVGIWVCAVGGCSGGGEEVMPVDVGRVKMYCMWDGILVRAL
jgi:hypothetical protein